MELGLSLVTTLSIASLKASRCQVLTPCTIHEIEFHMIPFPMLICLSLLYLDIGDVGEFLKLETRGIGTVIRNLTSKYLVNAIPCITSDLKRENKVKTKCK